MIITTTDTIDNRPIAQYLGLVSGEAVMGTNVFKDFFASIRDIVGGRSGSYQDQLSDAKQHAIGDMAAMAQELGADAIVGVDLDYEAIGGDQRTLLMVVANGTAVKLS